MNKEIIISVFLIILGFTFEYFYFIAESTFLDIKFWLSGIFCIVAGMIGLWIYGVMPLIRGDGKNEES